MKRTKIFSFVGITLILLFGCGVKANAELRLGVVEQISRSEAAGKTGKKIFTINLDPGYGVNLSFPNEEIISKVWFDNPGIASLDSNGCLSGLGRPCQTEGANILHLRSIKPINLKGLPKTSSSLLTVVTKNSQGHNIYLFQIIPKKSNKNNIQTVEIVPDSNKRTNKLISIIASQKEFNLIHRGLTKALNQNLIKKDSPLWKCIIDFSTQVRDGITIKQAAQKSGISMKLVEKLQELGR